MTPTELLIAVWGAPQSTTFRTSEEIALATNHNTEGAENLLHLLVKEGQMHRREFPRQQMRTAVLWTPSIAAWRYLVAHRHAEVARLT